MQQNIGLLDRYVRMVSGLIIYGCGLGMRRRSPFAKGVLMAIGAMKVAEGATGWCPIMQACGVTTKDAASGWQTARAGQRNQNGAKQWSGDEVINMLEEIVPTPASDKAEDHGNSDGDEPSARGRRSADTEQPHTSSKRRRDGIDDAEGLAALQ